MRQQINLYQPVFSHERRPFSAITAAVLLIVIATALSGLSVHATTRVRRLEREVAGLREQQAQQASQLAKIGDLRGHATATEIAARNKLLAATLAERSHALHVLQSGAAGQPTGFADRIEALARRHVAGLWIDALAISAANGSMSLSGGTLDAAIVPVYLHGLSQEAALSGTRFDDFVIERPAPPESPAPGAAAAGPKPAHDPSSNPVRFRAGSKSLAPAQTEAAP